MTGLTDTHTHLYLPEFHGNHSLMLQEAAALGVHRFVLPNIDANSVEATLALRADFPEKMRALMGLHPCSVTKDYKKDLEYIRGFVDAPGVTGIGEIGLDFYWDKTFISEQEEAFRIQLRWAMEKGWPVSIHSRESTDRAIEIVTETKAEAHSLSSTFTPVFHCFTGTPEQAKKIIELGGFLGIGGVVTFKNAGLDKVLSQLPVEHLLLETDAPYLAPVPHRGKQNVPSYLRLVAEKVAEIKGTTLEEISDITEKNASRLFGFSE